MFYFEGGMANKKVFGIVDSALSRLQKARYTFHEPSGRRILYLPFFSSIRACDSTSYNLEVSNGGLMASGKNPSRGFRGRVEVRIGDYSKGGSVGTRSFKLSESLERISSMRELEDAMELSFWDCTEDYNDSNSKAMGSKSRRAKYTFFSREEPQVFIGREKIMDVNLARITEDMTDVTKKLLKGRIWSTDMEFDAVRTNNYLINSEGSRIFISYLRYRISLALNALDSKNRLVPHSKAYYCFDASHIPSREQLLADGETLSEELIGIINSPIQKNGTFPVIMDQKNHGVLWHEVMGHALEAHRMQDDEDDEDNDYGEGKTSLFVGRLGHRVAPRFLTIYEDPTRKNLDGFYQFDEEGVKAQKVLLLKNGILKNYLHSRSTAGYFKKHSNGHARAANGEIPVPRMSNIIVQSSNEVPFEQLKENLIRECEKQRKKFGLIFSEVDGGLTLPSECYFKTYPSRVFRVYTNGKIQQVRGIYVVGTPYQVMENIVQTSDDYDVFKGYCGAESGWIPSSQVTPHALIKSLEINRIPDSSYREMKQRDIPPA